MLDDNGLLQLVKEPTQERNMLDLVATNTPSDVNKVEVIPRVSDHCVPLVELDIRPVRRNPGTYFYTRMHSVRIWLKT